MPKEKDISIVDSNGGRFTHLKRTSSQKPPYVKPLPYLLAKSIDSQGMIRAANGTFVRAHKYPSSFHCSEDWPLGSGVEKLKNLNTRNHADNNALANVDEQLRYVASFFEDWYERKQAYDLAITATRKLLKFAKNWKNPAYYKNLKGATSPSTLPEAWLLYNFGVKPLIGTIDRALHSIGTPLPSIPISGTGGTAWDSVYDKAFGTAMHYNVDYRVKIGCRIEGLSNPNATLIGATGLNEPFSSFLSVVPWGWAADYFVNVSQLASNMEMKHPGVKTTDWYKTTRQVVNFHAAGSFRERHNGVWQVLTWTHKGEAFRVERTLGQRGYVLTLDLPLLGSGKLANLTSALALTLKGKK